MGNDYFWLGFIAGAWFIGGLVELKYCRVLAFKYGIFEEVLGMMIVEALWPLFYLIFWLEEMKDKHGRR